MPNAENVTAIAVWMIMCINFVFGALVEYSYLLWVLKPSVLKCRRITVRKGASSITTPGAAAAGASSGGSSGSPVTTLSRKKRHLAKVDDICFLTFPILFFIFNAVYWSTCLSRLPSKAGEVTFAT